MLVKFDYRLTGLVNEGSPGAKSCRGGRGLSYSLSPYSLREKTSSFSVQLHQVLAPWVSRKEPLNKRSPTSLRPILLHSAVHLKPLDTPCRVRPQQQLRS